MKLQVTLKNQKIIGIRGYLSSTGYPPSSHARQPPLSTNTFAYPFCRKYCATLALVLSFFQLQ